MGDLRSGVRDAFLPPATPAAATPAAATVPAAATAAAAGTVVEPTPGARVAPTVTASMPAPPSTPDGRPAPDDPSLN